MIIVTMIISLIAAATVATTLQTTDFPVETLNPINVTFNPTITENYPSFVYELEKSVSSDNYVGQPIIFSSQNVCDPNNLYVDVLKNAVANPNVGIISVLNDQDPSKGGHVQISIENIEFSNSINEPRDEFTPASVLLSSFQRSHQVGIDPGFATICDPDLTQCVTLVR